MVQMLQVISVKFHHDAGTLNTGNLTAALLRSGVCFGKGTFQKASLSLSLRVYELIFV